MRERAADAEGVRTQLDLLANAATTQGLAERVVREAMVRVRGVGQMLVPGMLGSGSDRLLDVNYLVFVPVTLAVLWGWWRGEGSAAGGARGGRASGGGVLSWGGLAMVVLLVVAWPHGEGVRYLLPLLPVLWLGLFWALPRRWAAGGVREHVLGVVLILHLVAALIFQQAGRAEARDLHARWSGLAAVVEPVRGLDRDAYRLIEMTGDTKPAVRLLLDRKAGNESVDELDAIAPPHRPRFAFLPEGQPVPEGWTVDATGGGVSRLVLVAADADGSIGRN